MSDDDELYRVLALDPNHPELNRAFELGVLWGRIHAGETHIDATVHASNTAVVIWMADSAGLIARSHDINDEWTAVAIRA